MARHPQNGPTFSKAPQKKRRPLTDAELAAWQARRKVVKAETGQAAAKTRTFNQAVHKDPKAALQLLGLPKKK